MVRVYNQTECELLQLAILTSPRLNIECEKDFWSNKDTHSCTKSEATK